MKNRLVFAAVVALVLVASFAAMLSVAPSSAAPMPAPTPVSVAASGTAPMMVDFFSAEAMTADTTSRCTGVQAFQKADIYYSVTVEAGNINTATVYLQHGNSPTALTDGIAVASTVATDTTGMQQAQVFGAYLCLKVDATDASTGTLTVTANALVK